ncbi:CHAT domain-containing protein [Synechococcales cyanobacterium C]|uniref:CHAT domain-containing protein n=1 Tax=Petrachloros mirabilis ULC683 TaxID=2781853 RepID=A0A8K2A2D2_9CYAN|nr:CHAT domain-containing protein [Petrachloros mirabilis]NCJ08593.1 CHAT domain-containing protein [Petrachloros mirabilis ULC683]
MLTEHHRQGRWRRLLGAGFLGFSLVWLLAWGTSLGTPVLATQTGLEPGYGLSVNVQTHPEQEVEQGRERFESGHFAEAITLWQTAVERYRRRGDISAQIQVRNYLAVAYQQLGQISEAQAALEANQSALGAGAADPLLRAQTLNATGTLQLLQGQAKTALASWQEAEALYQQAQDALGQTGSLINQAQALQSLGFFWQANQTLTQVRQSLQTETDLSLKATGLHSLGDVLRRLGKFSESQTVLEQSLAAAKQADLAPLLGGIWLSLGRTAQAQQQPEVALEAYQQAVQFPEPTVQVQAQLEQLGLLIELADEAASASVWPSLSEQIVALPASRFQVDAQLQLIQHWVRLKQQGQPAPTWSKMAVLGAQALQTTKFLQDEKAEAEALGQLGYLYEQTQQWSEAKALTANALRLSQRLDALDLEYQWQWQLGRIDQAQGDYASALSAYGLAFTSLQRLRQELGAVTAEAQFSFRDRVEPVYREYVDLLLQSAPGVPPSQGALQQARQVMEALQVEELHDFFRSACLGNQLVPIDTIEQRNTSVLYPIVLPERLELILSLPQQPLQHYSVAVTEPKLTSALRHLRRQLELPYTSPEGRQVAQQLYQWLIEPIELALSEQTTETLVLVLDGALRNVPIAALYDGEHYLVEKYSVALAPGLQLVDPQPLRSRRLRTLAAGVSEARSGFSALVNVPLELSQLQAELPAQVLLDQHFTSQSLGRAIATTPAPIVHLATHGQFSSNADETFILAWDRPILLQELNTLLRRGDETRPNPIELLVLSACETAAGDDRAALGLAGIAVQAGARSTLASLWSINDESSAQFMGHFYQALAQGTSKAEALRQAQVALLNHPDYRSPLHWASYVLVGNWL